MIRESKKNPAISGASTNQVTDCQGKCGKHNCPVKAKQGIAASGTSSITSAEKKPPEEKNKKSSWWW